MTTFGNNCLLCLNVLLDFPLDEDYHDPLSMMTSDQRSWRQLLSLSLCQLVQNKAFESSISHQSIMGRHQTGGDICSLCHKCAKLADDMSAVAQQIFALQAILKAMVNIVRERIINSDHNIQADPEGVGQDLHELRQSLLSLSDERESISEGDVDEVNVKVGIKEESFSVDVDQVKVKVEIEEEEWDDYQEGLGEEDPLLDVFPPPHPGGNEQYLKQVEEVEEEDDSHLSWFINPQITGNLSSQCKMVEDIQTPTARKPGRPKKIKYTPFTPIPTSIPTKRGRGRLRKIQPYSKKQIPSTPKMSMKTSSDSLSRPATGIELSSDSDYDPRKDYKKKKKTPKVNKVRHSLTKKSKPTKSHPVKPFSISRGIVPLDMASTSAAVPSSSEPKSDPEQGNTFTCDLCSNSFTDQNTLTTHTWYHQTKTLYNCPSCDAKCERRTDFDLHYKGHETNQPIFLCYVCFQPFRWNKDMLRHVRKKHLNENTFRCVYCNQRFRVKEQLFSHISQSHAKRRPFSCDYCDQRYAQKINLLKHLQTLHGTLT